VFNFEVKVEKKIYFCRKNKKMAYSKYTSLLQFEERYNIRQRKAELFPDGIVPIEPSERLVFDLQEAEELYAPQSEKAKSEFIIAPILKELQRNNKTKFRLFSGVALNVTKDLNGICDFVFSQNIEAIEVTAPIFCLVEAKNRTVEEGFAQCAAEMYAARLFNEKYKKNIKNIYGCVTTGQEWAFLQLQDNDILIDKSRYFVSAIPMLLGILQRIVDEI
jgi:hypothetical protein